MFSRSYFSSSNFLSSRGRRKIFLLSFFLIFDAIALAVLTNGVTVALAQSNHAQPSTEKRGAAPNVARGKYLVEGVAVCGECHTPRDSSGNLDRARWLQGGSVPYMPAKPDSDWPINAPRIGGTPPASDADMIKLLTTGIWTNGSRLRLPMPQFRMERSDAEAVVAYLKTVTSQR
jgi:mono/diheme cytochrome c family protein